LGFEVGNGLGRAACDDESEKDDERELATVPRGSSEKQRALRWIVDGQVGAEDIRW